MSSAQQVNDDQFSSDEKSPTVNTNELGHGVVTWFDDRTLIPGLYGQIIEDFDAKSGDNFLIRETTSTIKRSVQVAEDGSFAVSWNENANYNKQFYIQFFQSSGIPRSDRMKVDEEGGTPQYLSMLKYNPVSNNYLFVWENVKDGLFTLYDSIFDVSGNSLKPKFAISTYEIYPGYAEMKVNKKEIT